MPVGLYLHVPTGSASRGNYCETSIMKNRRSGCRCRKYCTELNHPRISTDLARVLCCPPNPPLRSTEPPSTQWPHGTPRGHLHPLPLLPLLSCPFLHEGLSTCFQNESPSPQSPWAPLNPDLRSLTGLLQLPPVWLFPHPSVTQCPESSSKRKSDLTAPSPCLVQHPHQGLKGSPHLHPLPASLSSLPPDHATNATPGLEYTNNCLKERSAKQSHLQQHQNQ